MAAYAQCEARVRVKAPSSVTSSRTTVICEWNYVRRVGRVNFNNLYIYLP